MSTETTKGARRTGDTILADGEPAPVAARDGRADRPWFLTCDHAGRHIPARLGDLGLPASELSRHIAWDIGAAAVSRSMAEILGAALVEQVYSRLVIDCNRPPDSPTSIPTVSESTIVPGNADLSGDQRRARLDEVFRPYHDRIADMLDRRGKAGRQTVLVAMHSFTPVYKGEARPWHIGTLYGRDARLARALHPLLVAENLYVVGDNEPYAVSDGSDYTIPVHGEARGFLHVGIEIRQDLVADAAGQARWAETLSRLLPLALARISAESA